MKLERATTDRDDQLERATMDRDDRRQPSLIGQYLRLLRTDAVTCECGRLATHVTLYGTRVACASCAEWSRTERLFQRMQSR